MFKKLLSDTVIYGLTTMLMKLINYLLVPLHTEVFTPDSFGIVSYFYAYAVLFNIIYTYGMETTYFRYATKKDDGGQAFNYIQTSLLLTSILFSSLLWFFAPHISDLLGYANSEVYVRFFALLFAIDTMLVIPFANLRILGKAKRFASLKLTEALLTYALNYFFLVTCKEIYTNGEHGVLTDLVRQFYDPNFGLGYTFLANLITKAGIMILLFDKFLEIKLRWSWSKMKPYLQYGFPLVFSGIAFAINEVSDRQLLKLLLPDHFYSFGGADYAIGIYSANYKLSIFITLAVTAYKYAAEPFFFATADSKNSPKVFANVMYYFVIVLMMMVLVVVANLSWIAPIFIRSSSYLVGLPVVPILLMANVFLGMYYNLSVWFKVTDQTKYGAYISFIGAAITIGLNTLLIPIIGFYGSAIATLSCYFTMMVLAYVLGQKYYPIPYNVKMISFYIVLTGIFVLLITFLKFDTFAENFIVHNSIFALFLIIIAFVERKFIKQTVNTLRNKLLKK
ncbi:oligosaccharide flippase family protein [Flammeovirga kamogawensis]|nr:polysaccharide biosynthesis C-terminal domain-containing protein [Flammeovirga kamogawensis]TRX69792.1 oligosaccharide flippase family protein [Flammeovirga kamogawensis]